MSTASVRHLLKGIGVSPGYALGPAYLVDRRKLKFPKYHIEPEQLPAERTRFLDALTASEEQINQIKTKLVGVGEEHFLILDAHQMMLRDEMLIDGTCTLIEEQLINAEWALRKVIRGIKQIFDNIDDEYFRERRADVNFVGNRILRNLVGGAHLTLSETNSGLIIAHDLSPADTAMLLRTSVLGFATDVGGKTSHTAIMARSLELPAVVGLENISEIVGSGDFLIIDGVSGTVLVNPTPSEITHYQVLKASYHTNRAQLDESRHLSALTTDGHTVRIAGNIELPEEAQVVLNYGAESVGLYRTEYLYMNREALPDEEEQYQQYRKVIETAGEGGATIRTLDLGGDKFIESVRQNRELNPVLGLRAVRFCLKEESIFRTQLRALLRASAHGSLRIMFPLISGLEEVRACQEILATCRAEVDASGYKIAKTIPIGIMVELPCAAVIADLLAQEVDFFAIGTNDLIQYTLAIDRSNENVAHLYQPLHPALLRILEGIVSAARDANIPVSMCGEMAGDPFYVPVLLGLGLRELSMNTVSIPLIKSVIRALDLKDCQALFAEVRTMNQSKHIEAHVARRLQKIFDGVIPADILETRLRPMIEPPVKSRR